MQFFAIRSNPITLASILMAFPYRRILSPIDFEENSIKAIAVASDFAFCNQGVILLLHVVSINRLHGGIPSTAETQRAELAASNTKLAEIAHRYTGGARNELSLRLGDPAEEIIKAAIDFNADVIVMATHGWVEQLLGSPYRAPNSGLWRKRSRVHP